MSELKEQTVVADAEAPVDDLHAQALSRLERKREFHVHLSVYLVVNALIWLVWGLVYAYTDFWFPWPLFPLLGWGIGLGFHAWATYGRRPFSQEQIEREIARLHGGR